MSFYFNDSVLLIFGKYFVVLVKNLSGFFLSLISPFMSLVIFKVFYYLSLSLSLIVLLLLDLLTLALDAIISLWVFLFWIVSSYSAGIISGNFLQHWKRLWILFCQTLQGVSRPPKYKFESQIIMRIGGKVFDWKRAFSTFFWPKAQPKSHTLPYCHLLPAALSSFSIGFYTHFDFQFDFYLSSLEIFLPSFRLLYTFNEIAVSSRISRCL